MIVGVDPSRYPDADQHALRKMTLPTFFDMIRLVGGVGKVYIWDDEITVEIKIYGESGSSGTIFSRNGLISYDCGTSKNKREIPGCHNEESLCFEGCGCGCLTDLGYITSDISDESDAMHCRNFRELEKCKKSLRKQEVDHAKSLAN